MTSKQLIGKGSRKSARGFTLVELLVVLLLLSVLLAVVIPVVSQQSDAADAPRVANDLTGIRDGIAMFRANVRDFPGDLEDLVNLIVAGGTDSTLEGDTYSSGERKRWKGPYVELALPVAGGGTGTAFLTAFDGAVENDLTCFVAADDSTGNRAPGACTTAVNADSLVFVTVTILGLGQVGFDQVNELIDGIADTTSAGNGDPVAGRLRRRPSGSDTTFYLAVPIPRR